MRHSAPLAKNWLDAFYGLLRTPELSQPLRSAALEADLLAWTAGLTTAIVRSCETLGGRAAAKGYPGRALPVSRKEYLSLDVTAFAPAPPGVRWPLPVAAFELENKERGEWVGYSLWKLLCVRVELRVVFAYRHEAVEGPLLVARLADEVVASLTTDQRLATPGATLVVIGHRGEAETFPYGYFRAWRLEVNTGRFERI
jgi:hypothetical protein